MRAARCLLLALGFAAVACPPPAPVPREPRIRVVGGDGPDAGGPRPGEAGSLATAARGEPGSAPPRPGGSPDVADGEAAARDPGGSPLERTDARPKLGRCSVEKADGRLPPAAARADPPPRWSRFRQRRLVQVGYGYLHARFSPDGSRLLVHSDDEARLRVYDATSGALVSDASVEGMAQFGRFAVAADAEAPSAERALVAVKGELRRVDTVTGNERAILHLYRPEASAELQWTSDLAVLGLALSFIPAQRSELSFFVRREGALVEVWRLACSERVDGFALDDRRERLLLSFYPSNEVALHDLGSLRELWRLPAPRWGGAVALSPDGTLAAVGGEETWLLDVADPSRRAAYTAQRNNTSGLAFSPDGSALAMGAYDGKARLFLSALTPGKPLTALRDFHHLGTANVYEPAFSHDGRRLVTASGDKSVRVWGE